MNLVEKFLDKYFLGKFFKHSSTKKIANNTLWLSFDKIIKMVLGVVVGLNVAKYLGPKDYGEMSYGMLYFSFFLPLATLGIDSFVVRDLSQRPEDRTKLMGSIFSLRIMGALVAIVLAMATAFFLQSGQSQILTIIGINVALFFMQSFESCDLVFQSQLKSKYPSYVRTINYILFSGIKLWFIYQESDLMAFVWVYAIELFFNSVFLAAIYQRKIGDLFLWRPDLSYMQSWMKESPILILQGFAVLAQARMDQFMLEKILDIKAFGEYSLASRLIEMTYFLPAAIYTSAAPRIAEAKLKSEELYQEKLKNLYKLMILLFLAMALPIVTLGKFTIDTFFEGKFEQAGLIFVLLGSRMLYINISTAKTVYYVNENQMRYSMLWVLIGVVINFGCNLLLIPAFHVFGAIISMNITAFITTFVLDWLAKPTHKNSKILASAIQDIIFFRSWRIAE